ncbi:MAG: phosphoribosyltransferase [Candidatus Altiarchaeota archaeon]|nr:phosphoribosyltransferase [Candidatus Altiarchaeota archaeon]
MRIDKKVVTLPEIDEKINELLTNLDNDGFKPDLVIGITRGGAVLGRIIAHELGCDFDRFHISNGHICGEFEKLARDHSKILIVDDNTNRGHTAQNCILEVIRKTNLTLNPKIIVGGIIEQIANDMWDFYLDDNGESSYQRSWAFQRDLLKQINPKLDSDKIIDSLMSRKKRAVDEYKGISKKNIKNCTTQQLAEKYFDFNKQDNGSQTCLELLLKNAKIDYGLLENLFENGNIKHNMLRNIIQNGLVDICLYVSSRHTGSDCMEPDFSGFKDSKNRTLPWTEDIMDTLEKLDNSSLPWRDITMDEIKKQYKTDVRKHQIFEFYEKSFLCLSDGVKQGNKPSAEYILMLDGDKEEFLRDFYRFLDSKGINFYRMNSSSGTIKGSMKLIALDFDFHIKQEGGKIKLRFITRPHETRNYAACSEKCKKEKPEDCMECKICSDYKRNLVYLTKILGIYDWIDSKYDLENIEYASIIDGKRLNGFSMEDIMGHIRIIKRAYDN